MKGIIEVARTSLLICGSVLVCLVFLELAARGLTAGGVLEYYQPMRVESVRGEADWRLHHVTANTGVVADPVLFWKPRNYRPYNAQSLRGPVATLPKPAGVFRVMSYGDSNTDGPPKGGAWTERLGELVAKHRGSSATSYEVINAGVTGYTSHQGLLRFKQEAAAFSPDVVFVSFGWNDASPGLGRPDKGYVPPNPQRANLLRQAFRSRLYLVLVEWFRPKNSTAPSIVNHRVELEDYRSNLLAFVEEARKRGIFLVLLTRPYASSNAELRKNTDWRSSVPDYNDSVRVVAKASGTPLVDVQQLFSEKPELFTDECHFTLEGHRQLAQRLFDFLEQNGRFPRR